METRAHHVIIGLFTLIGFLLALAFGVWLTKSDQLQDTRRYRVVFEGAVSGLAVGSLVQYNGLKVGEVRRLQLDPKDPRRVLADIEVSNDTPINQGTKARLSIANITGATNILLSTDNPAAPPLEPNKEGPPLIIAEPSQLGSLLGHWETLLVNLNQLASQGAALLTPENIKHLQRTLHNLEQFSDELLTLRAEASDMLTPLTGAAHEFEALVQQTRELVAKSERIITVQGEPAAAEARRAMTALAGMSTRLEQLLTGNTTALDQGLRGVSELGPALQELRRSLSVMNRVLTRLEEDPAGYLTGKPPVQEFSP